MANANTNTWCERLFGRQLTRCTPPPTDATDSSSHDDGHLVPTSDVLLNADVVDIVGVYFSFANINLQCDEFVRKLKDLYAKLNASNDNEHHTKNTKKRRLEVIQVVLWANNDVYGDFEGSHRDCLQGLPWYAMCYSEIELKTKLSRRYRIKSGAPTLVLLESRDGAMISISAQERLAEDPTGAAFPWRPRPADQVLADVPLTAADGTQKYYGELKGIRGFYFSAHWCPPCRAFTPQLADAYAAIRKRDGMEEFEVIFVSSDRSIESYTTYVETMPWLSVPFQHTGVRAELAQLYGVRGIPTLLLLDGNGHTITADARSALLDDPHARHFPWKPRAVNVLTERYGAKLHDYPAIILFVDGEETDVHFAETLLQPIAADYYHARRIDVEREPPEMLDDVDGWVLFLIAVDSDAADVLRDLIGLDDVVPLLAAIDLPNGRFAMMDYATDINAASVAGFVDAYAKGALQFANINASLTMIQGAGNLPDKDGGNED